MLKEFLHVEPDAEYCPVLYTEELGTLGEWKTDRQRIASPALLYVWYLYYRNERMNSNALKEPLELSDISSNRMDNM